MTEVSGASATAGGAGDDITSLTGSQHYQKFGSTLPAGTKLNIHPMAWSGSVRDAGQIQFVYKGGLDGSGRP